ncbi:threonylcarbamoyl-AMP synthase [Moorella thermoacetica]|uniref:Threonylcarbamoyl-AMP synthase n=1 Tax=Neomoorella thermoacetica TaxID=1525 RepID=A0A1D7XEM4_NEOTH|nr:L-threonylcarbamoyladenylate synthase [Moorella thermoacetica]AKX95253.1 threonylcarbamoyl-AMP synthase [Moorella thermoacetica]AKX97878.1 threonylcarbamoyl-AMP synthase [Moorella thermoacetica]AOQ25368.1 Threonylcarbamoyl-AMP synthase [Moorella thermoacetica]APC09591.1 threonylcarbamoyl-AMP synthase [Moorella thermoacetica]OIQ10057.1 threonylcarbamoyl-AMP synthase [Moorella thermoacetica]
MSVGMRTKYLKINPLVPELHKIRLAAKILARGGVVAFPTETVYGLGANALDGRAVRRIFRAKGRPADNPLIVHIASFQDVQDLVAYLPPRATLLMQRFWPGPLTLIMPRSDLIPDEVTAGLDTVGLRMPSHPVAQALIRATRLPIAAPSANTSGRPSPTTGQHVLRDLRGKIDAVIDGGPSTVGVESTVLDLTSPVPTILRPGGITYEELQAVLGKVAIDPAVKGQQVEHPKAPGMKYKHYAPAGEVFLVTGDLERVVARVRALVAAWQRRGRRVAVLATSETAPFYQDEPRPDYLEVLGSRRQPETIAANLFGALRNCDRHHADIILAETVKEEGIGLAIMNRLRKSAANRIIRA